MIIGLVGKPSAGKSTFFKASTLAEVAIASHPFTTINKNEGVGFVKVDCVDKEFNVKCQPKHGYCLNNKRFVPVQMIDVAGLVPGAHAGKGMGNQFLDDLRQADVLIHVIDVSGSTNEKGETVEAGSYDPADDIRFLEVELDHWYLRIINKGWERFSKQLVQEKKEVHKALGKQLSGLKVTEDMVKDSVKKLGLDAEKPDKWENDELLKLATELRKKTKPMLIACNKIDIPGGAEKFAKLENEFPDHYLIACSAECELALKEAAKKGSIDYVPGEEGFSIKDEGMLNEKQKKALEFVKKNVLERFGSTGVQKAVNTAVLDLLEYIAVYPVGNSKLEDSSGNVLPDCFLIPPKTTALDFAFRLHTDFGKNFIKAVDLKKKQAVGKEHLLGHGDVVEIVCGK